MLNVNNSPISGYKPFAMKVYKKSFNRRKTIKNLFSYKKKFFCIKKNKNFSYISILFFLSKFKNNCKFKDNIDFFNSDYKNLFYFNLFYFN